MFVLDYITYTQSSRKSIVGPVVGGVVGGLALLFATVFLFWLWGHLRQCPALSLRDLVVLTLTLCRGSRFLATTSRQKL